MDRQMNRVMDGRTDDMPKYIQMDGLMNKVT